jgi:hypothetical protein
VTDTERGEAAGDIVDDADLQGTLFPVT